jgi:hypothetical protein
MMSLFGHAVVLGLVSQRWSNADRGSRGSIGDLRLRRVAVAESSKPQVSFQLAQ